MRPERKRGEPGAGVVEIVGAQRVRVIATLDAEIVTEQLKRDGRQRRRQEEERERTPIFGLTANALDEQRDSYLNAGMDLHLVKPIRLWELAESIQRWTGYQHQKD